MARHRPGLLRRRVHVAIASLALFALGGQVSASAQGSAPTIGAEWPNYNGTLDGQRFSPLTQVTPENTNQLAEVCRVQVADRGSLQAGPLMVNDTLYVTTSHDTFAIDPTTCGVRWSNHSAPRETEVFSTNRGVAFQNGRVFRGTPDGLLMALDARTGEVIWKEAVADPRQSEFISAAPTAWEGVIIVGTAGGDWGIRGRVMGFDAITGREIWRFNTIPIGDEQGADTWKEAGAAQTGGGGSWTTYTVDLASGEVFVPVGNPSPDFTPDRRPGEDLFTDGVVVLDARTGRLKWWYQLTPHDGNDLDLAAAPMLYYNSQGRRMVALAGKDGHVYGVDRDTHQLVFRTAITTIQNQGATPTEAGVYVCPGALGGTEWNGPAYDVLNKAVIVPAVDWCNILTAKQQHFTPGQFYMGGLFKMTGPAKGWVDALDPDTGEIRWRYNADGPVVAGVTPTAGGVVLTGDMVGNLLVLDSKTGKLLRKLDTGGALAGGVITYSIDGRQYVASTSGNVSRLTFGELGKPSIVVYALQGGTQQSSSKKTSIPPSAPTTAAALEPSSGDPLRGAALYTQSCAACHGAHGEGATGPALLKVGTRLSLAEIVAQIENPAPPMPKLYPAQLDARQAADLADYLKRDF